MHDNLYIFINKDINMFIIFLQIYNRRGGVVVERLPRMGEIRVPPSLLNDHNCRVWVNICSSLTVMVRCPNDCKYSSGAKTHKLTHKPHTNNQPEQYGTHTFKLNYLPLTMFNRNSYRKMSTCKQTDKNIWSIKYVGFFLLLWNSSCQNESV